MARRFASMSTDNAKERQLAHLAEKEWQLAQAKARLASYAEPVRVQRGAGAAPAPSSRAVKRVAPAAAAAVPAAPAPAAPAASDGHGIHRLRLQQLTARLDRVGSSDAAARRAAAVALTCAVGARLRRTRAAAVQLRWRHWVHAAASERAARADATHTAEIAALEQRSLRAEAELREARVAVQASTRAAQAAATAASQARGEAELEHDELEKLRVELRAARQGRAEAEGVAAAAEAEAAAAEDRAAAAEAARAMMAEALAVEGAKLASMLHDGNGSGDGGSDGADGGGGSAECSDTAGVMAGATVAVDELAARRQMLGNQKRQGQQRAILRLRGMLRLCAGAELRARRRGGVCGTAFARWASWARVATDSMCWCRNTLAMEAPCAPRPEDAGMAAEHDDDGAKRSSGLAGQRAEQQHKRQQRRHARRAAGAAMLRAALLRAEARQGWGQQVLLRHALRLLAWHSAASSEAQRAHSAAAAREAVAELSSAEASLAATAARTALGRAALRRWLRCVSLQGTAAMVRAFGRWRDGVLAEEIAMQAMELSSGRTMARCLKAIWRRRAGVAFARWRAVLASSAGVGLLIELRAQLESTTLRRLARTRAKESIASALVHWAQVTGVAAGAHARRQAAAAARDALEVAEAVCRRAAMRVLVRCGRALMRGAWQAWRSVCAAAATAALLALRGTVEKMALSRLLRRWVLLPSGLPAAWRRWVGAVLPWLLSARRDAATQCITTRLLWRAPSANQGAGGGERRGADEGGTFVAGDRIVHARLRDPTQQETQLEEHRRAAQARALEAAHALQAELEVSANTVCPLLLLLPPPS
jgi:hypothetical protein